MKSSKDAGRAEARRRVPFNVQGQNVEQTKPLNLEPRSLNVVDVKVGAFEVLGWY
jgi:hypothetical protein